MFDLLVQCAPQGDIHQLGAAADTQYRQVVVQGVLYQVLFQLVPFGIVVLPPVSGEQGPGYTQHQAHQPLHQAVALV
jgi:hypothetical protein